MTRSNVQIGMGRRSLSTAIDTFFAERGQGVNAYVLRRARMRQIVMLEAQSDADLAAMGLRREDILPHVFADLLGR